MNFIAFLVSIPTALLLFFFPAPLPEPAIAPTQLITGPVAAFEVKTDAIVTKEKVTGILENEGIKVHEITPTFVSPVGGDIPQTKPMPEPTPVEQPAPTPEPVAEVQVATSIDATFISPRPLYSGCSVAPVLQYKVVVKDQNGEPMYDQKIAYTGSAENNPSGEFLASKDNTFNYTDKNMKEVGATGEVSITFTLGNISKTVKAEITQAPTDVANRPGWCD